jgi:hypothetical protein
VNSNDVLRMDTILVYHKAAAYGTISLSVLAEWSWNVT